MIEITLIEFAIVAIVTFWLLYTYSAKDVPFYVHAIVYITWLLCFSIVAIIPLDVYYVSYLYHDLLYNPSS